jgi:hypothetical protein
MVTATCGWFQQIVAHQLPSQVTLSFKLRNYSYSDVLNTSSFFVKVYPKSPSALSLATAKCLPL